MELGNARHVFIPRPTQVTPMQGYEAYRRQAAFCTRMAEEALAPDLKESWLRLAAEWLTMLPGQPSADERKFDAMNEAKGTRQQESPSSH